MKVKVRRDEYRVRVLIDPFGADGMFRDLITVSRERILGGGGDWNPAQIHWYSIGAQPGETTMEFAHALTRAVGYAERLNEDIGANILEQD